jgi:hypothetical protein
MLKHRIALASVALVAFAAGVLAEETVKSGPQVGENARPKPFFPLNINGPKASEKACLVCRNGDNPVAMVFARDLSPALVSLIKKLDDAAVSHKGDKMGSFAVFCSDSEGLEGKLKELADKEKLKEFVLAIDNPTGPAPYKVAKDADITVVLYNQSKVLANHTFKKGELNDKAIEKIMADVPKIFTK